MRVLFAKPIVLIFFIFLSASSLQAEVNSLATQVTQIFRAYGERVGVSIRDPSGQQIVSLNAKKDFVPASVAKLVSSACALKELGPDHRLASVFYTRGEIQSGVLKGDLVIQGFGDFSFVIEDLKMITEKLFHVFGIRKIEGDLVFLTGFLEQTRIPISEDFSGDRGRAFSALLSAVPINHNSFSVWVSSSDQKARAQVFPVGAVDLKIENTLKVTKGRLGGSRTKLNYLPQFQRLSLSGQIGERDPARAYYLSLPDPYESYAGLFRINFVNLGGEWKGKHRFEKSPKDRDQLLYKHESRSISRLLIDINKLSTNFGSEMLNLHAAFQRFQRPATLASGQSFLKDCLSNYGLSSSEMALSNASGLARDSQVQAEALSQFLHLQRREEHFPEYLASLSILGRDGTTRRRLPQMKGEARLKTGSIRGVNTIAGYVGENIKDSYSMVLLLNCESCNMREWEKKEDEVISLLISHSKK